MGLLTEGRPLSWEETHAHADHVRKHGIQQFIHLYHELKNRQGDVLKWGDEIEYCLVKFDHESKRAKLSLRAQEMLPILRKAEDEGQKDLDSLWRPEYAAYMIEGTPGGPYGGAISEFNTVEKNMKKRRKEVQAMMGKDEAVFSMSIYPRLGCKDFTFPDSKPEPETSFTRSLFWPSEATYQGHPRFKTLSRNIRERRGEKVNIQVPVYRDDTSKTFLDTEDVPEGSDDRKRLLDNHIYMDAMGFGMGLSCLQVTFQACNLVEAERLYDQLAPVCPIFLALTASSPIFKGLLADVDCRWNIISASVDCRTKEERNPQNKEAFISKSRYDSISSYLSDCAKGYAYNDIPLKYDEKICEKLRQNDIKELMAQHISHLFIRDTVSLFSEKVNQDDATETDHFENIQSTNWQTMRFKPPPPNSPIGWRVEFRPCELQFTDFENAAVVSFIVLLTRALLSFNYNLLVPISMVDENMRRSQKRDAVLNEKFFFRTNISTSCGEDKEPIIKEMTVDEIINGSKDKDYPGLLTVVQDYLKDQEIDTATMCTLSNYWKLIKLRSSGALKTNARYMRDFVLDHPEYKKDSKVTDRINYDLLMKIKEIEEGVAKVPELFGDLKTLT